MVNVWIGGRIFYSTSSSVSLLFCRNSLTYSAVDGGGSPFHVLYPDQVTQLLGVSLFKEDDVSYQTTSDYIQFIQKTD